MLHVAFPLVGDHDLPEFPVQLRLLGSQIHVPELLAQVVVAAAALDGLLIDLVVEGVRLPLGLGLGLLLLLVLVLEAVLLLALLVRLLDCLRRLLRHLSSCLQFN